MKRLLTILVRSLLVVIAIAFFSSGVAGCKFAVAGKPVRVLVTTRVPERSVDYGEGEKVQMPSLDPAGNTFFIVFRMRD